MKKHISTIILILTIIVLIVCLVFCIISIYKKNTLVDSATEKSNELQTKVDELEGKVKQMEDDKNAEQEEIEVNKNTEQEDMAKVIPGISQDRIIGDYIPGNIKPIIEDTEYGVHIYALENILHVSYEDNVKTWFSVNNDGGKIEFPNKIVDSKVCTTGQSSYRSIILTLLEDGTVYINYLENVTANNYTPEKLDGVEDVVRIYKVSVSTPGSGFFYFAVQKIDGSVIIPKIDRQKVLSQ